MIFSKVKSFVENEQLDLTNLQNATIEVKDNSQVGDRRLVTLDKAGALALIGTLNLGTPERASKIIGSFPYYEITLKFNTEPSVRKYIGTEGIVRPAGPASGVYPIWRVPQPGWEYFLNKNL